MKKEMTGGTKITLIISGAAITDRAREGTETGADGP